MFHKSKRKPILPLISLIILLTLIPLAISFLQSPDPAEAAWVDDNFAYRNAIPISSHTAAENNVYVSATIDTSASGQFQSDCGDLRFTTVKGDILPYYIVSGCTTATTVVHIFFDTMPAGAQTLYYYYGNPSAANGFSSADFATQAASYAVGSIGTQEKGGAPILYWKLDDGTGTNVQDSSQLNLDGTIGGSVPPVWQPEDKCISGKCLYFDSSNTANNGKVVFNESSTTASNIIGDVTISLWAKPTSNYYDTGGAIIRNGQGADLVYSAFYDPVNKRPYFHWYDGAFQVVNGTSNSMPLNQWSHLTITRSSTTLKIYVNGVLTTTATVTAPTVTASQFALGQTNNDAVAQDYNGYVDDVKIYNYARTAAQIKSDFKSRGTAKGSSVSLSSRAGVEGSLSNGLVGYWKMDESSWTNDCSTTSVTDSSGNGNNGKACPATTGPTGGAVGKFGNGGSFDGSNDYLDIADNASLKNFSSMTVSTWFKATNWTNQQVLISKDGNSGWYWQYTTGTSALNFYVSGSNKGSVGNPSTGVWHHLVATYDGAVIRTFLDGSETTGGTLTGTMPSSTGSLFIGAIDSASYRHTGSLDETRIYNRALSPREVRDLYAFAPGPVGYWNMDEGTGNPNDSSGNGNNGTWNGTGTQWTNGKFGKAGNFNGSDGYITINHTNSLNVPNAWTSSAWVYLNATPVGYPSVFTDSYPGSESKVQFDLSFTNSTAVPEMGFYNATSWYRATAPSVIPLYTWTYLSGTYDGPSGTLKMYVNGILVTTTTGVPTSIGNVTTAKRIGRRWDIADYINGKIDEVKLYNYARTQKQIVEDMNAGHPVGGSPVGSQVGYWKFDEGYGSTAFDTVGGNTGTLTSSPSWSTGKFGKSIWFNNNYVSITNESNFDFTSDFTLSGWINVDPNNNTAYRGVLGKYVSTPSGWDLGIQTGKLRMTLRGTSSLDTGAIGNDLGTNTWHYFAVVNTPTSIKTYEDGVLVNTTTGTWTATTNNNAVTIGNRNANVDTAGFYGRLDEVKIYNSALTEDEIKLDYNRGSAMVLGTLSDTSGLTGGSIASSSATASYCVPGGTDSCSSPVGEWNFEEKTGTNAYDTSGNGNTGTLSGGTTWASGKVGSAIDFDGTNGIVSTSITTHPTSFTVEAWANTDVTDATIDTIISKFTGTPTYNGFFMRHQNGSIVASVYNAGTGYSSTTTISAGSWNHWAMSFDGSTIRLYKNGQQVDSDAGTMGSNTTAMIIGGNYGGASEPFNGKIDQVKYFNYARTPVQIAWDYNRGAPVGHWKMDECQGGTANDSSGNGNSGTITIGATGTQTAVGTCTTSGTAWGNGATGKYNSSLNFDGTDDYISVPDPSSGIFDFGASQNFTIATWIKTTSNVAWDRLIGKTSTPRSETSWYSVAINSGKARLELATTYPTYYITVDSVSSVNDNSWHHLVFSRDKTGSNNIKVYIDGKLETTSGADPTDSLANSAPLNFMKDQDGVADRYLEGQIDDVRIYNYALTATQVKNLFNGGAGIRFGPATGSP